MDGNFHLEKEQDRSVAGHYILLPKNKHKSKGLNKRWNKKAE